VNMIKLTDSAVNHLKSLISSSSEPDKNTLRLWVEKGGCAGMEYQMKIAQPKDDDIIFEFGEVTISLDSKDTSILEGCSIDYTDDLSDSGLKISNPNAARSCGCGTSFEPKTKEQ
jgi:iron-sulfur cluster assembly accessory protein